MTGIEHLSLLSGPLRALLTVAAFAALAAALAGTGAHAWRRVAALGIGSLAAVVAVGTLFGVEHRVGSSFPQSFFVWAALPVFAGCIATCWWSTWPRRRRALSVATVLLLAGFGAECVNVQYAYLPTVGDAIGRPVEDQVPAAVVLPPTRGHLLAERARLRPDVGHGVVLAVDIPGVVSRFRARSAMVWLPPAYFATPSPSLPVLLLLAGVPGDPADLLRAAHVAHIADVYAAAHDGVAPILVFPDHNGGFLGDSECVDGPRGNVETYLTVDVPLVIAERFHASVLGRDLGIGGYSEGGTCAATLTLRHPERFAAFLDIAGDLRPNAASGPHERQRTVHRLYGGDARQWALHDPISLLQHRIASPPTALFAVGDDDTHALGAAQELSAAARRAGLPASLHVYQGNHTFTLAHRALADLFPALADQILRAAATSHLN